MQLNVVTYDVSDDRRRERLATLLSGYGPRVQLSVFECMLRSKDELQDLRAKIREIVDTQEDQVRMYNVSKEAMDQAYIIGAREIEERRDFWLIR